jgi:uncharacterized membrane protein YqjE
MTDGGTSVSIGHQDERPGTSGVGMSVRADPKDKSLAELLRDLSQQLTALLHDEVELAKAEIAAKGKRLGAGAELLGAAAALAVVALGALAACVIAALALALPVWLAALIVAVVLLGGAAGLGLVGKAEVQRASPPVPEEAVESTKEDVAWLKTQVKSAKP